MITEFVGWAVVHSLWQGMLIALAAAAVFRLMRGSRATLRYAFGLVALASMVALPVLTSIDVSRPGANSSAPTSDFVPGLSTPTPVINPDILTRTDRVVVPDPKPAESPHFRITSGGTTLPRRVLSISRFDRLERAIPFIAVAWILGLLIASLRLVLSGSRTRMPAVAGISGFRAFIAALSVSLAATLLYHHPAARWLVRKIRGEAERTLADVPAANAGKTWRFQFVPRLAAGLITITSGLLAGQQTMRSLAGSTMDFRIAESREAVQAEHGQSQTIARAEPEQDPPEVESDSDDSDDQDDQDEQAQNDQDMQDMQDSHDMHEDQGDRRDRIIRIERDGRVELDRAVQSIVIRRALEALSELDGDRGIPALEELARSQNREVRTRARQILRHRRGDM